MEEKSLTEFIEYASKLKGYEKGEAQLFLDRLFIAFGQKGVIEAKASLEYQIRIDNQTKFCDLIWPKKVLFEMKKRGSRLSDHFIQAKSYWDNAYSERTKYVVLCNFDEFWIYDWNLQKDPLDKIRVSELNKRWRSLAFLCIEDIEPIFRNNFVEVTTEAADKIALLYNKLIERKIENEKAQRFVLQCLVALFAEHSGLLPREGFFQDIINKCVNGESTSDLFTSLFKHMNNENTPKKGIFKDVSYFDGGIFSKIYEIELNKIELDLLSTAAKYDWSKVQPSIFGSIFEDSLHAKDRHRFGAHFTYESDIIRIVEPSVIRPWREKIRKAKSKKELDQIRKDLSKFKILDPACGSGNFLYISYRELKQLELELLQKIKDDFPSSTVRERFHSVIKADNFYGIDTNELGIELSRITLSIAKKFAADEFNKFTSQQRIDGGIEKALPFYNLDKNIICEDALFEEWPKVDVIIGNPPYQSKNKMQEEFGRDYLNKLHEKFPDMPGRADYCVYWFRKAHDSLPEGGRAGLVGTNTIRQTDSRKGGLDYITKNNGTILEAVSTTPWSGKAVVHVSIVNWIKQKDVKGKKTLAFQYGEKKDGPWEEFKLNHIPSSLSYKTDITEAKPLEINKKAGACYQGQTHGHEGFILSQQEKKELLAKEPEAKDVIFPYLIAEILLSTKDSKPDRYVIDFQGKDIFSAKRYIHTIKRIEYVVLPTRKESFEAETKRNKIALDENPNSRINLHHKRFYDHWWLLSYPREELISRLNGLRRYIACSQVTKRPIFEFVSTKIRPNAALIVFPLEDDYSFGILQSSHHWEWFKESCSTLKSDYRYTSDTVFDTFPWPQWGLLSQTSKKSEKKKRQLALNVAIAARELRDVRNRIRKENNISLRDVYRAIELPGENELKKAQKKLDESVWKAYYFGLPKKMQKKNILEFLLSLNELCFNAEEMKKEIIGPGLPAFLKGKKEFISADCIRI
jgi:hypothetical protein